MERKIAMTHHYKYPYTLKPALICYLGITMMIFSIGSIMESLKFNDCTFYETDSGFTDLTQSTMETIYTKTCNYNYSDHAEYELYDEWKLINNDHIGYNDSYQWIELSVFGIILCFIIYSLLIFGESCLLVYKFKYNEKYPNSPYLTSIMDRDSFKLETLPQTKKVCDNIDDIMVDEEEDDEIEDISLPQIPLSPINENQEENDNEYVD